MIHCQLQLLSLSLSISQSLSISYSRAIQEYTTTTVTRKENTQILIPELQETLFIEPGPTQYFGGCIGYVDMVFVMTALLLIVVGTGNSWRASSLGSSATGTDFTSLLASAFDGFGTVTGTLVDGFGEHIAIDCTAFGGGKTTTPRTR